VEPFATTADVHGQRVLRSAETNRLIVPPVRLSTVGSRAFPVAVAQLWNSLPEHSAYSESVSWAEGEIYGPSLPVTQNRITTFMDTTA